MTSHEQDDYVDQKFIELMLFIGMFIPILIWGIVAIATFVHT